MHSLHEVNGGIMVLLPKTTEATNLKQFWSISLIHSMGKLISRLLANRLTPSLSELVHPSQSAFVKKVFYIGQLQVCAVGCQTAAREEMACPAPEGGYSVTF
jgi:hypothetical protein